LPKTIDDNGRTLQFQGVQWKTDATHNVDDYEIGNRYTAVVTYGGVKTSSYVKGYAVTADYTGEALRKGVTVIRYTVIFNGIEIPAPEPATLPSLEPETTTQMTTTPATTAHTTSKPTTTEPVASVPVASEQKASGPSPEITPGTAPASGYTGGNANSMIWLPILLSVLALLICGACVYFVIKNRKESTQYEKAINAYSDPYPDNAAGDNAIGDGDGERT
jgi:hypothetical protein